MKIALRGSLYETALHEGETLALLTLALSLTMASSIASMALVNLAPLPALDSVTLCSW